MQVPKRSSKKLSMQQSLNVWSARFSMGKAPTFDFSTSLSSCPCAQVDVLVVMHRQLAGVAASLCPGGSAVEGTSSTDHVAARHERPRKFFLVNLAVLISRHDLGDLGMSLLFACTESKKTQRILSEKRTDSGLWNLKDTI